ncbi:MAG: hypothetical protein LBK25_06370 [Treponema sp.]|nr:hypothetical protein [Treponema sp.]
MFPEVQNTSHGSMRTPPSARRLYCVSLIDWEGVWHSSGGRHGPRPHGVRHGRLFRDASGLGGDAPFGCFKASCFAPHVY